LRASRLNGSGYSEDVDARARPLCIIRVMLPGVAQARPPQKSSGAAVPQGHQMGFFPQPYSPGSHAAIRLRWGPSLGWNGSTLFGIWQRLHMSKPVTRGIPPPRVQQNGLNPSFPAVQGMPPQSAAAPNGLAYLCRGVKFFSRFCHNLFPAALGAALWVVIVFTLPRILTPAPQSR